MSEIIKHCKCIEGVLFELQTQKLNNSANDTIKSFIEVPKVVCIFWLPVRGRTDVDFAWCTVTFHLGSHNSGFPEDDKSR